MNDLVSIQELSREFDVSRPWLNRLIERMPRQYLQAVSDVTLNIPAQSIYGLVGESGSGKSTIGKIVVGLLEPSSGTVEIDKINLMREPDKAKIAATRADIQMIFQDPYASLNPRWKVRDIVVEPVRTRGGDCTGLAARLLEQVGLSGEDGGKYPHEFSGGQRQRICIARAIAARPRLIVCDEPTSALDVSVQAQVLNLMSDLQEELGLTYLLISHDLTVVRHMADQVGVLYLGRLIEEAPSDVLFDAPKHPYTRMLIEAAPKMDGFGREAEPPQGEIPDPINPPSGCAYHPRCPLADDQCRQARPELKQIGAAKVACFHAG